MRIAAVPEGLLERVVTRLGLAPTPIVDTLHAVVVARAIVVGVKLGVFDALEPREASAPELAQKLGLNNAALEKLLNLLVAARYLRHDSGRYRLTRKSRRWLLGGSATSLHDNMLLRVLEWQAIDTTEAFVRTGKSLDVHELI